MKIIDFLNQALNIVVKIVIDSIGSSNLIKGGLLKQFFDDSVLLSNCNLHSVYIAVWDDE